MDIGYWISWVDSIVFITNSIKPYITHVNHDKPKTHSNARSTTMKQMYARHFPIRKRPIANPFEFTQSPFASRILVVSAESIYHPNRLASLFDRKL